MAPTDSAQSTLRAVATMFAAILPDANETCFLQACLESGETGRRAWSVCEDRFGDLVPAFREDARLPRRLAPLLAAALVRNGLEAPPLLVTLLRTATLQEELRTREYLRIIVDVSSRLREAHLDFLVLNGPALATLYDQPWLRHNHDFELLFLRHADVERAARILEQLGAHRILPAQPAPAGSVVFLHPEGLPIGLRARLFRSPHYDLPTVDLWRRRSVVAVDRIRLDVLSPEDALLHVLAHATYSTGRVSLQWVADAWHLIRRHRELDWERFQRTTLEAGLALVVAGMLRYLAHEVGAPVPNDVLVRAGHAMRDTSRLECDALFAGVRATNPGALGALLGACTSSTERLRLIWWLLAPSPTYLRRVHRENPTAWPLLYVYRPLAFAARTLRSPRTAGNGAGRKSLAERAT